MSLKDIKLHAQNNMSLKDIELHAQNMLIV